MAEKGECEVGDVVLFQSKETKLIIARTIQTINPYGIREGINVDTLYLEDYPVPICNQDVYGALKTEEANSINMKRRLQKFFLRN